MFTYRGILCSRDSPTATFVQSAVMQTWKRILIAMTSFRSYYRIQSLAWHNSYGCNWGRAGRMVANRPLLNILSLLVIAGVSLPQCELTLIVHLVVSES